MKDEYNVTIDGWVAMWTLECLIDYSCTDKAKDLNNEYRTRLEACISELEEKLGC